MQSTTGNLLIALHCVAWRVAIMSIMSVASYWAVQQLCSSCYRRRAGSGRFGTPVHDVGWQAQLSECGSETCHSLLKLVSLAWVAGCCHNGHVYIAAHEVNDVADHLAVMLHVSTVSIERAISIKGDQLQTCC